MKPNYQHLGPSSEVNLINTFWVKTQKFGFHWHYHPELEITCVKQGRGTRLVGDNVSPFNAGDFVFLGSNLPHTWISDDDFNNSSDNMEVAVLQFHPDVLSPYLMGFPDMKNIRNLLNFADRGISIDEIHREKAAAVLFELMEAQGLKRFTLFLSLLDFIGQASDLDLLASNAYLPPLNHATEERILKVCQYVHDNFMNPIQLTSIAKIANMNPTSFCRFFRKSTGQSLFEYINDLRIGKACNLLLDKRNFSISSVAYQSGFKSQTLFNRIFLRKKNITPGEFRKRIISQG